MVKLYLILIMVVVTQIYTCVKMQIIAHQKRKKNQFFSMII